MKELRASVKGECLGWGGRGEGCYSLELLKKKLHSWLAFKISCLLKMVSENLSSKRQPPIPCIEIAF